MPNFRVAVLIDGGFLRAVARKAGKTYDPDFIEKFAPELLAHADYKRSIALP